MFPISVPATAIDRRTFLKQGAASSAGLIVGSSAATASSQTKAPPPEVRKPTQFQIACMTLPYSQFPLRRALTGLKSSGYGFVAWGTTHKEPDGKPAPVLPVDAPPDRARELGKLCRDLGLEPLMMFSSVYPDASNHLDVFKNRIRQAAAAGIPQILTFGNTQKEKCDRRRWVEHFKMLGPMARDHGVLIVLKPHGGLTADGARTAEIVHDIADDSVKVNYDAGNVMDYLHIDPVAVQADFEKCSSAVRSFCIKDHRRLPKDEDCGPGLGEIDHYRLLAGVSHTSRAMPLCCENIFAPLLRRPATAEGIDALARRAREFLELATQGVQA